MLGILEQAFVYLKEEKVKYFCSCVAYTVILRSATLFLGEIAIRLAIICKIGLIGVQLSWTSQVTKAGLFRGQGWFWAAEPSRVWTRFPFTNLVLLHMLGKDTSPGEAHLCLGRRGCDSQHLAGDAQGSCMTRHWQNTFEKPPPQMKIPLWETGPMYWTRVKSVKHLKRDRCQTQAALPYQNIPRGLQERTAWKQ